jgi:ankyrin repeat protein
MNTVPSGTMLLALAVLLLSLGACSQGPENSATVKAEPPGANKVEDVPTAASPLAKAAIRGDLVEIKALLEAGAEVNVTDALGRTPLHMAAFYGRTKASELLLTSGAKIDARDRVGMTPLHAAVLAGGRYEVELLLERKADVSATTDTGQTPLHLAAATGQPKVSRVLIERGADPESEGQERQDAPLLRLTETSTR